MKRRSFMAAMLAASIAPVYIRSGVLMKSRSIIMPDDYVMHNGILLHSVLFNNGPIVVANGDILRTTYTLDGVSGMHEFHITADGTVKGIVKDHHGIILLEDL